MASLVESWSNFLNKESYVSHSYDDLVSPILIELSTFPILIELSTF